jgi:hypothetical protein
MSTGEAGQWRGGAGRGGSVQLCGAAGGGPGGGGLCWSRSGGLAVCICGHLRPALKRGVSSMPFEARALSLWQGSKGPR